MSGKLIIGIDADVEKNGFSVYDKEKKHITAYSLTFFQILDFLKNNLNEISTVKIEAGYLIAKSNWHQSPSINVATKIAKQTGRNHQTSILLVEMCKYLNLNYQEVKPLKKIWKNGKISQLEIELNLKRLGITFEGKKNQDVRDSILICLY